MENNNSKQKKIIRTAAAGLGLIFIISVTGVFMVNFLMEQIIHTRKEVITPDIEGMTMNEALTLLSEKNLSLLKVAEKYDTTVPAGSIISQSPPPGLTVREGKAVEAVISSGGKVVFVPEVEGKSIRQAELMLRQASLVMGEQIRTYSNTVKRDFIVSQDPEPGKIVEKNSYVNVVVSRGPAEEGKIRKMVNLLGRNIRSIDETLKELGVEVTQIETTVNDELKEGTIVAQSPKQGEIIDGNTRVELTITKQSREQKEVRDSKVYYEVSQSGKEKQLKIVVVDDIGERVVFEGPVKGGSKIEKPVKLLGEAAARIFVDEIMVKEEKLE